MPNTPPRQERDDALPTPGILYDDFCRPPGYSVYYALLQDGALAFRIELPTDEVTPDRLAMWRDMARSIAMTGPARLRLT
ncbi:MAG TPA: hypothetical protein VF102_07100 [Gemmatimonadaceae bacterium]